MPPRRTPKLPKLVFGSTAQRAEARLREAILYVASKCETAERFGAIKLNKILAFADFNSFARHGTPITGVEYMRQAMGPVPRRMKPVLDKMERAREIAYKKIQVGKHIEQRVIALREPDLSGFSGQDISIIEEVIRLAWNSTATQLSAFSHGRAWQVAGENGKLIPYEAVFLSDREPTLADVARARELNRKYQWEEA